jgi:hypothetical protein
MLRSLRFLPLVLLAAVGACAPAKPPSQPMMFGAASTAPPPPFRAGAGHRGGLVADPGGTLDTTKFLRMDNAFAVPAGGGGGNLNGGGTAGSLAKWSGPTDIVNAVAGDDYLPTNGNGGGLTNLNASALASGTVPAARLALPIYCSVAIQAACDAGVDAGTLTTGGTNNTKVGVFIPSGRWYCASPVFLDADRVTLFGPSAGNAAPAELHSGTSNHPPVMAGYRRLEPWKAGSPEQVAGYPTTFSTNHRSTLDGEAGWDGTQAGRGLNFLRTRMPGSTMAAGAGDHWIQFYETPPQTGPHDHWGSSASQKMTVSFPLKNGAGGTLGIGPLFGMGETTNTNSVGPMPWMFTLGNPNMDPAGVGSTLVWFIFKTKEGGTNSVDTFRQCYINTPATSQSGWHHYTFHVDFTANDSSGCCRLLAWVDGVQTTSRASRRPTGSTTGRVPTTTRSRSRRRR